jgi:hypothetical protein
VTDLRGHGISLLTTPCSIEPPLSVNNRGLCAVAQAESLKFKLIGGLAVRRAAYGVIRFIMEAGAKGVEVRILLVLWCVGVCVWCDAHFSLARTGVDLWQAARSACQGECVPRQFCGVFLLSCLLVFVSGVMQLYACCVMFVIHTAHQQGVIFRDGYMIKSGQATTDYVDKAGELRLCVRAFVACKCSLCAAPSPVRGVLLRQGVLGIQLAIMLPPDQPKNPGQAKRMPDVVTVRDVCARVCAHCTSMLTTSYGRQIRDPKVEENFETATVGMSKNE